MVAIRLAAVGAVLALIPSCAALQDNMQGPMQPQSVSGPCEVKRFFLLGLRSVPATMTIANTGQACRFTLINPALNAVINAALLTGPAQHGTATVGLITVGSQAAVSYTPAPGYAGRDKFDITLEPNAVGVTVDVEVKAP